MARRSSLSAWSRIFQRSLKAITRSSVRAGTGAVGRALQPAVDRRRPPPGAGQWIAGLALGSSGVRRYRLFRPDDVKIGERLPLLVMLHGCGQDARSFALSTRMNRIAARERFVVLYPEQDRLANAQRCWNWFETSSGRAYAEGSLIMNAVDQACLLQPVDASRIALAGLSSGASMAALLATRHPERFKAVVMHSGIPPGMAHSSMSALRAMHGHRHTPPLATVQGPNSAGWPALMVIHGRVDPVVSVSNGHAAVQAWADAAGALPGQQRSMQRGKRYGATVTDYKHAGQTVATLVEVGQLGHAWSGGVAQQPFSDARGPDASRMVWAFAAKQFRLDAASP